MIKRFDSLSRQFNELFILIPERNVARGIDFGMIKLYNIMFVRSRYLSLKSFSERSFADRVY